MGRTAEVPVYSAIPRYLYHFTTQSVWRKIQADGHLCPSRDQWDEGLYGIWAVEPRNFKSNWLTHCEGIAACCHLFEIAGQKLEPEDSVVVLRIRTHRRQDHLWVRDIRPLLYHADRRRFVEGFKPVSACTRQDYEEACIEFIFRHAVPVSRVRLCLTFPTGGQHADHLAALARLGD